MTAFDEHEALRREADDPLPSRRSDFLVPPHGDGEAAYLAGNSLGLQPRATAGRITSELDD